MPTKNKLIMIISIVLIVILIVLKAISNNPVG